MRLCAIVLAMCGVPALVWADDKTDRPLTTSEAAKKIGENCKVEMLVKSTGKSRTGNVYFLNSNENFRDKDNFTIMIGQRAVAEYKKKNIEDPVAQFKGKTIRVTGTVKLYMGKPEIIVNSPDQIEVVEKK